MCMCGSMHQAKIVYAHNVLCYDIVIKMNSVCSIIICAEMRIIFNSRNKVLHLVTIFSRGSLRSAWARETDWTLDAISTSGTSRSFLTLCRCKKSV